MNDRDDMIRRYAAGEFGWSYLQSHGWDSFGDVLESLGRLGLRYPILGVDEGDNAERRGRGRARLRELIAKNAEAQGSGLLDPTPHQLSGDTDTPAPDTPRSRGGRSRPC